MRAHDLAGMAEVAARSPVPVVADESFHGADDIDRLVEAGAAHGVNLKLAKLGGPRPVLWLARRAARRAQADGGRHGRDPRRSLAMAHVVAALGGVDWVDLDTAHLLAEDPFQGGWMSMGRASG